MHGVTDEQALRAFTATEAGLRDRDHARLRARLGEAAFEAAYRHGHTLSHADAIALATGAAEPGPGVASTVTIPAAGPATADGSGGLLSDREREIVALLADGATDAQIAGRLFLSVNTVRSHLDRIRDETGARRRTELVHYAIQAHIESIAPFHLRAGPPWPHMTGPGGKWAVRPTPGGLDGAARPLPSNSGRTHAGFTAPPLRRRPAPRLPTR